MAGKPLFWAITIALAFFAINLSQIGRYGLSLDEPAGMERGREAVEMVAELISPAPGDEDDFASDWLNNHPPFYATCNYGVSSFLVKYFGWQPIPAGHFLNLLTASAGLVVIFLLGRLLFNPVVGLAAEMFMVLFPRFIAHAQFNAKDVPVMVLGTLALWLLNLADRRGQTRYWILAGLGVAVATTTKLDGLFVLPIFLIPWLTKSLRSDHWFPDLLKMEWFLYTSVFFIFLLWPELWLDPLHLFHSIAAFAGEFRTTELPYLGHMYPMNQVPWHYIPVHLIVVTPLLLLAAGVVGAVWSLRNLFTRRNAFEHGLLWCWILIPVLPRMWPGIIRYDGMRHVFLMVPAMAILAGFGVDQLLARWKNHASYKVAPVVLCGMIGWSGWQIVQCHPYEGFYLNEAVRAVIPGPKLVDYFDFKGWGSVYTDGVKWVNAHAPPHAAVALGDNSSFLGYLGLRKDLEALGPADMNQADYVLVGCWSKDVLARFHSPPVFCVRCYGANLLSVYARTGQ
ncbi:MAG TPA: glycosyltransferase family 39 protein [Candidatus Aquilonibacter sp.]|nr:glycosyltransferase family 39 protein [Candidatus Aquilonibacter sp.]